MIKECFVCGKTIEWENINPDFPMEDPMLSTQGIYFSASGNWPSSVWDPLFDDASLEGIICDECLKDRLHRVEVLKYGSRPVLSRVSVKEYESGVMKDRDLRYEHMKKVITNGELEYFRTLERELLAACQDGKTIDAFTYDAIVAKCKENMKRNQ